MERAYLRLFQFVEVWRDIEEDPIHGARQSNTTTKQDEQHEVRVRSWEVHHLWSTTGLLGRDRSKDFGRQVFKWRRYPPPPPSFVRPQANVQKIQYKGSKNGLSEHSTLT